MATIKKGVIKRSIKNQLYLLIPLIIITLTSINIGNIEKNQIEIFNRDSYDSQKIDFTIYKQLKDPTIIRKDDNSLKINTEGLIELNNTEIESLIKELRDKTQNTFISEAFSVKNGINYVFVNKEKNKIYIEKTIKDEKDHSVNGYDHNSCDEYGLNPMGKACIDSNNVRETSGELLDVIYIGNAINKNITTIKNENEKIIATDKIMFYNIKKVSALSYGMNKILDISAYSMKVYLITIFLLLLPFITISYIIIASKGMAKDELDENIKLTKRQCKELKKQKRKQKNKDIKITIN